MLKLRIILKKVTLKIINYSQMSKTSRSKSKNFQVLYYNLKEEYDQMQKDNDEICKEYESTIQILTDSIKELQNQRSNLTKKMAQVEKEKEKLQDKNREKINDIQDLNQKNQKLYEEILSIKNKNKEKEHQIVILENDTEHFLKLIRQNEALIDELNYKLEEALEDNVTIQTEFEVYKQIMGEKLTRKSDELKEIKNDIFTKNLIIKKLKNKKHEKFIDSKYLDIDDKSTTKKNINLPKKNMNNINLKFKEQRIRYPTSYTRDNIYSINYTNNNNESDIFKNISINTININEKFKKYPSSIKDSIKINPYIEKQNQKKINSFSNKIYPLKTPSNYKKIIKNSSSRNDYNDYSYYSSYKNNYENIINNNHKEIQKFDLNDIDINNTTSGLDVFRNGNDEIDDIPDLYQTLPNLVSNGKIFNKDGYVFNDDKSYKNSKNSNKVKPYNDAFLRKIFNSKKLNNNLEKLYNYNQRNKGNKALNKYTHMMKKFAIK